LTIVDVALGANVFANLICYLGLKITEFLLRALIFNANAMVISRVFFKH
jgi:hypothetical protein